MDIINDLRSIMTVVSLVTFLGIVWWAFSRGNSARFDEAARLPLSDDDDKDAPIGASRPR